MCEDLTDKGVCLGQQGREVSGLLVSCIAFGPWVPLFGRKDVSLPPGTGTVFPRGDLFLAPGGAEEGQRQLFAPAVSQDSFSSVQSLSCVRLFATP